MSLLTSLILCIIKVDDLLCQGPKNSSLPHTDQLLLLKLMEVQDLVWVRAVLRDSSPIHTVPSVLLHTQGLMLI